MHVSYLDKNLKYKVIFFINRKKNVSPSNAKKINNRRNMEIHRLNYGPRIFLETA